MKLHGIDVGILVAYFALMIAVGVALERRASQGMGTYFLGGNKLPWWTLSLSNAASMFDISGTMWLVSLLYVYGMKSVFIPWLWPVFNQIFLMIYLSRWLRRSGAMTGGEWITLRFGQSRGAEISRISVVVFALVSVIGFTSYAFVGIGKFAAVFLPDVVSPNTYGLIICGITTLYTVMGGLLSVVVTDLIQFVIMLVACLAIGVIAMMRVSPGALDAVTPAGWRDISFGWVLDLDWSGILPSVGERIAADGYGAFGALMMMMVFKGVLVSVAGPAPNYDMQRILAARTPREASFMSGLVSLVLFFPRYFMVAGIAVLALVFMRPQITAMGKSVDFESLLPLVIRDFVPVGLVGVLLAGLLAAFMSTFAGTINAAAAYITNDIYKRYINPHASERTYIRVSWVASIAAVVVGAVFGFFTPSVSAATDWIVSALWGGYAAPNLLKWHWWRLNGHGYFWGMMAGIGGALLVPLLGVSPLTAFPILLALSLAGSLAGSLLTEPQDMDTLKTFYRRTRPWGFWGPVAVAVVRDDPAFRPNREAGRDLVNVVVGTVWQTALVALPIYVVIREAGRAVIAGAVVAVCMGFLKKNWLDKLEPDADEVRAPATVAPRPAARPTDETAAVHDITPPPELAR